MLARYADPGLAPHYNANISIFVAFSYCQSVDVIGEAIPNWINAIASVAAFGAAGAAAVFAWQSIQREKEQALVRSASGLAAWWVKRDSAWGLVVANSSDKVFTEVRVFSHGNRLAGKEPLKFQSLPPGQYFVESMRSQPAWGPKHPLGPEEHPTPLTDAQSHGVDLIEYRDMGSAEWAWSPNAGLTRR